MPIINKTKNTAAIFNRGREVVKVYDHGTLAWQKQTNIPDYLCFTALEAGQFTLTIPAAVTPTYLSYVEWSKDGRTWNHRDNSSDIETIDVQVAQGEKVYWRGSGESMGTAYTAANMSRFSSDARFNVSGHIISLLKGDDLIDHLEHYNTSHIRNATFAQLFNDCTTLVDASELSLPTFTSYSSYIFYHTFHGCTSLIAAPALPSLQTATQCYRGTFQGCTSLVTAPSIAATTLDGTGELYQTFQGCTALVTPPTHLYPSILNSVSYYQTFQGCNHMTTMPELHFTSLASNANHACYQMFSGCLLMEGEVAIDVPHAPRYAFSGTFGSCKITKAYVRCPSADEGAFVQTFFNMTTLADIDIVGATTLGGKQVYLSCFYGCRATRMNIVLPATTLTNECYKQMFYSSGGTINHITCLATDISATDCTLNWLVSASSTGTFIQAEGVEWPRGASGIPTGWVDVEKRTMPSGYKQLLQVTSNGTAYIQLSFGFEETDEVEATFSVDTSQTTDKYIVCPQTWNSNNNRYGMGVHNYGQYTAAFGNLSTGNTILTPRTYNNGELHNWTYAAATFAVTDKSCSINITGYTFGGITTNLRLFYGYNSNTKGAISSYKHIKGSTTACDFVAAVRESDDTAGLYDLANDEFVTCNGLTAGEEI